MSSAEAQKHREIVDLVRSIMYGDGHASDFIEDVKLLAECIADLDGVQSDYSKNRLVQAVVQLKSYTLQGFYEVEHLND